MVVLLGHCRLVYGLPENARALIDVGLNQRAAVLIFFVLSGYVLTFAWLRLREEPRAIFRFYIRRFFRLMPALWAASAGVGVADRIPARRGNEPLFGMDAS